MEKKYPLFLVALILLIFFGSFALATQEAKKPDAKVNKDQCLACHGPYEKIIKATAEWKAPSGETVTPHQYVPHAEKTEIPECTECHTPHAIPLEDKASVVKPKEVEFCYAACHHVHNLQACNNCH